MGPAGRRELQSDVGLVAQEVERVLPELVHTDAEGMMSVDYSRLSAVLVEAVKEQQAMINELREEVSKLKADARR